MQPARNAAILLFDDAEVLDFCGPFEVFSVAGQLSNPPFFRVYTVAETTKPVLARNGLSINPQYALKDAPEAHLLVIPGGQGTRRQMNNGPLLEWIRGKAKTAELVLSVCTGSLLLGKAGLLDGLEATTHGGAIDLLRRVAPKATVHADRRFVDNGRIICSAGIAAGIDMCLHVVERLAGAEMATKTAQHMEYPWRRNG